MVKQRKAQEAGRRRSCRGEKEKKEESSETSFLVRVFPSSSDSLEFF
jgi:hypothetical protein